MSNAQMASTHDECPVFSDRQESLRRLDMTVYSCKYSSIDSTGIPDDETKVACA